MDQGPRPNAFWHRRRAQAVPPQPRSCVRVLRDESELADALGRAMAYERNSTERYRARLVRYDETLRHTLEVASAARFADDDEASLGA